MDREVILKFGGEEVSLGFVSDFSRPRDEDTEISPFVLDSIREAIALLDLESCETKPVVITIQ